jgi:hypothetical protein
VTILTSLRVMMTLTEQEPPGRPRTRTRSKWGHQRVSWSAVHGLRGAAQRPAQRNRVAGELRQQALQEVLVLQQAHRPDAAPLARPRRLVVRPPRSREAVNKHGRRCDSGAAK